MNENIVADVVDYFDDYNVADGQQFKVKNVGRDTLSAIVNETVCVITLSEAYNTKDLAPKLLSCCKIEKKGGAQRYEDGRGYLKRISD